MCPMPNAGDADAPDPVEPVHGATVPRRVPVEAFVREGESLVYHAERDEASALNRTATEVWELCDGSLTVSAIAGALGSRYGVDAALLFDDVVEALFALRARGLIEFAGDPAAPST